MDSPTPEGWVSERRGPRVLYRLPGLVRSPHQPVYVTEGERDADTLAEMGLVTTTVANSAWSGVDLGILQRRTIILVVDADEAGWKQGTKAHRALTAAGAIVDRVLRPAEGCKDITEHLGCGMPLDQTISVDLSVDPPPASQPSKNEYRKAFREDGLALYAAIPSGVFIGLRQASRLEREDLWVYLLLEERAGQSGEAHLSAAEIARLLKIDRHAVGRALARLHDVGLASEKRQGRWAVFNPARKGRAGLVDRSILFKSSSAKGNSPSPPTSSTMTPGSGAQDTPLRGRVGLSATWICEPGGAFSTEDEEDPYDEA